MSTGAKKSLKLPIFLMVGPVLGIVLSIFLFAIVNFIFSGVAPEPASSSGAGLADGASIAQGAESDGPYGDASMAQTISNVLLFLLGAGSMLAFLPCLIIGIIMLSNRRNPQADDASVASNKESRTWGDVE